MGVVGQQELAAHPARQLAADREPEPEASVGTGIAAAPEALEHELPLLGRHARAGILDGDRRAAVAPADGHAHRLVRRGEAKRVVHEDADRPRDAPRVARGPAGSVVAVATQLDALRPDADLELGDHRPAELAELDRLASKLDPCAAAGHAQAG